ncbi:MAG: hypothetical protein HVN35_07150 [Methanobacteriaceae archaeon]|nr:hypothetical protein [Methanobacteriaceae archaeon]
MSHKESNLPPVSAEALEAFQAASDDIIKETVKRSLEREDEVIHHGDDAGELITSGITFTTQMLEAAMSMGEIPLLEDELQWAKDRLPHDGVELEHVKVRLQIYRNVVSEKIPAEHSQEINQFIDWMINRQEEIISQEKTP